MTNNRSGAEIRQTFIDFFVEHGHTAVPSSSLVPGGDSTLLFTNSGMVQFKDVLTGAEQRSYTRAVDYQRVLRVAGKHNDFEEVGRTPRHHTFFEMLGNWSFGDYFKRDAILWAWQFLTRNLKIPAERLAATTYTTDDTAHAVWRDEIGLPPERLVRWGDFPNGDEKNWWRMADIGPCGPCSEIHFDRGAEFSEGDFCVPDHSEHCPRWLEIWNLVFMEFERAADGTLTELPFKSVDTGMGLERMASALQGVATNYDTDLFVPIHSRMRELMGHDPDAVIAVVAIENALGHNLQLVLTEKPEAAQQILAAMYDVGKGTARDPGEALRWYKKAAEQGDAIAQYVLGVMYQNGEGVKQDYVQAYVWLDRAAKQELEAARRSRDAAAAAMSGEQLAKARRLSGESIRR